jgi:hypothetical protein
VGRPPDAVKVLSGLEVIAQKEGSFSLSLSLRRDAPLLPDFDIGVEAIGRLADGLGQVVGDQPLPEGYDDGVLMALREAGKVLDRGIESVDILTRPHIRQVGSRYDQRIRDAIAARLNKFRQAWVSVEGRLLMADVKEDILRCRLHPSAGDTVMCSYDERMATAVIQNLRRFVRASGEATLDPTTKQIRHVRIGDIESIEEPLEGEPGVTVLSSFWHPSSFEELAVEQAVYPVSTWESLVGGWPDDADFDRFLENIREARAE